MRTEVKWFIYVYLYLFHMLFLSYSLFYIVSGTFSGFVVPYACE